MDVITTVYKEYEYLTPHTFPKMKISPRGPPFVDKGNAFPGFFRPFHYLNMQYAVRGTYAGLWGPVSERDASPYFKQLVFPQHS